VSLASQSLGGRWGRIANVAERAVCVSYILFIVAVCVSPIPIRLYSCTDRYQCQVSDEPPHNYTQSTAVSYLTETRPEWGIAITHISVNFPKFYSLSSHLPISIPWPRVGEIAKGQMRNMLLPISRLFFLTSIPIVTYLHPPITCSQIITIQACRA
jgi:hypothetical protein